MAKLAVLTDRGPSDLDWKGAYIWKVILSLAESQHEVLVLTPLDPELIPLTHPRLTVIRPAVSWRLDHLTKWLMALLQFRPEVIHTFAPLNSSQWSFASIWPYLNSALSLLPDVKRVCTLFEISDFDSKQPFWAWLKGAEQWTVFTPEQADLSRALFKGKVTLAPLEGETPPAKADDGAERFLIVPAPVDQWRHPTVDLFTLADHLQIHPDTHVEIVGGWGRMSARHRREGWEILQSVSARIKMRDHLTLDAFKNRVAASSGLWLRALNPDNWTYYQSVQIAAGLGKPIFGVKPQLNVGSTANFLSRLYSQDATVGE
jgi:hypothetical protein